MITATLTTSEMDLILHSLTVTGSIVARQRTDDDAERYDQLHDRLAELSTGE